MFEKDVFPAIGRLAVADVRKGHITENEEFPSRSSYKRYTAHFKEQALERVDRNGIPKVAQDLGVAEVTLYAWKAKRRQTGQPFEDQKPQQAEMARLKRENARLEEEVASLKKSVLRETAQVKYPMIIGNENHFSTSMMCHLLLVTRSGLRLETQVALSEGTIEPVTDQADDMDSSPAQGAIMRQY